MTLRLRYPTLKLRALCWGLRRLRARRLESEALSRREIGVMEMSWIFYSGEPCLSPDGNFSLGPGIRTLSFLANA